jgi:hypothetical protein
MRFRRFRNTYLRNYTECPEGLYKYWMGHAGKDMSDLLIRSKRTWRSAENGQNGADSGSSCPQLYRMYRKLPKKPKQQKRRKQLREREKEWSALADDFRTLALSDCALDPQVFEITTTGV